MKRISMTDFRKSPGEFLLDVIRDGKSYMLTKAGKDAARLLPAIEDTVIESDGRIRGERPLTMRWSDTAAERASGLLASGLVMPADVPTCGECGSAMIPDGGGTLGWLKCVNCSFRTEASVTGRSK